MLTTDTLPIYDSLGAQPKWIDPTKTEVQKLEAKVFEDDDEDDDIEEDEEEDEDIPDTGEDDEDEEDEEHGY